MQLQCMPLLNLTQSLVFADVQFAENYLISYVNYLIKHNLIPTVTAVY